MELLVAGLGIIFFAALLRALGRRKPGPRDIAPPDPLPQERIDSSGLTPSRATVRTHPTVSVLPHPAKGTLIRGKCWVIDGDTIVIASQNIRLFGIDAPEMDHPYGKKAKWELHRLCNGQEITAEVSGDLSHDRLVARCTLPDGRDLSAEMVKAGMAIDWAKYSGGCYRQLEPEGIRKKLWRADARQKGRMPPTASTQA